MEWLYNGSPVKDEDVEGHASFVYKITRTDTGRAYIGKKKLTKRIKRKPLKGKKRNRIEHKESDWRSYYGSNELLQKEVEELGEGLFRREILRLCKTVSEASYFEAKYQFEADAILSENYYNEWIMVKVRSSHLRHLRGK